MNKIAFASLKNQNTLVALLLLGIFVCASFIFASPASAQLKTNDELQKAAESSCKQKNDEDNAACRNGYRHGYRNSSGDDETKTVACVTRTTSTVKYSKSQQDACSAGYEKGVSQNKKDGGGSTAVGKLGQEGDYICGTLTDSGKSSDRNVHTKFDFGCLGTAYAEDSSKFPAGSKNLSPILDFIYAIIRFLSIGVGIAITIALIISGIQYSASEGNAEASTKAKKRVESAITGLVIYVFSYALLQFLIPGGVFK